MDSNHTHAGSKQDNLTVVCYGRIQCPEDDPLFGTYWTRGGVKLGVCANVDSAITLAERSIAQPSPTFLRVPSALAFVPDRVIIRDSKSRLVLAGEISRTYLVWFPPITSDDETYTIRAAAKSLRDLAFLEHRWDNFSSAEDFQRRADFLEGHLVDPVSETEVTSALRRRAASLQGLARRHPRFVPELVYDDYEYDFN